MASCMMANIFFSSLAQNITVMFICSLKELLVAVIIPLVHTGLKVFFPEVIPLQVMGATVLVLECTA